MKNIFRRTILQSLSNELEEPIRAEIFGVSRFELHAESLAHAQKVTDNPRCGRNLAPRIENNQQFLAFSYHTLLKAVEEKRAITPAAEWLIDNFHIIKSQLKDVRDHLPPEYYQLLPKIADGPLAGYPRVFGIAWAFVAHTDSRLDLDLLKIFLASYQKVQPLTIGELWAIPITLRLVLIENLRRFAARIVDSQQSRLEADQIADSLLGVGELARRNIEEVIESIEMRSISRGFAVQILQRLRFQEDRVGPLMQYIEQRLSKDGILIEDWVTSELLAQSAANVSVRNIITSARLMSAYDWSDFFEHASYVDKILSDNSNFASLDFTTRDRYRHRIELLSRGSSHSEIEITEAIIQKYRQHQEMYEPGYFLIGEGRFDFEKSIGYTPGKRARLIRFYQRNGVLFYLSFILLITILISIFVLNLTTKEISFSLISLATLAVTILTASDIATAIINRWTVAILGPKYLPRLNFENSIPEKYKTFIVVPTMLTDVRKIRSQLEQLEIHYLSNQDANIYLALLSDFSDAKNEKTKTDDLIIQTAFEELKQLNARYPMGPDEFPRFSIFHRRRLLNQQEGCWMGWERKRGKLHEFNRLLLGANDTSYFDYGANNLLVPTGVRYVVTLDADTKLPRGSVAKLVGTMAHPLNQARFDETLGRVVSGYGILQPRITPSLPSAYESTIFRKLSTVRSGIDPYASAVSDVYQDLFEEGSFTGKGIYDLAIFEKALKNKIPENMVLSHDLLEGNFARCGYLSDVDFFEDFPSHTGVASMRTHRWIRGDWQLLPWIFGKRGTSISIIGHWKMLDNLRRSLVAPASLLLFFISVSIHGSEAVSLLTLLLLSFFTPTLISLWVDLWPRWGNYSYSQHLLHTFQEFKESIARALMSIVLLPHNAWICIDAIFRSCYRMFISHKKLLEWTTTAQAQASANLDLKSFFQSLRGSLLLAISGSTIIYVNQKHTFLLISPILLIWLSGPLLAYFLSRPPKMRIIEPVKPEDIILFHATARKIWRFFATLVNEKENFLPPDNFQEDPVPEIAHRSSPTNFGLYLLSVLAARDFGWLGVTETIERLESTLKSLLRLERHKGHFLNWYDTLTSLPLEPRYISSVDNGNLAGHLIAVAQGCEEILNSSIKISVFNRGVIHTVQLLDNEIASYKNKHLEPGDAFSKLSSSYADLLDRLMTPEDLIEDCPQHFLLLRAQASLLLKHARVFSAEANTFEKSEILSWCLALQNDIQSHSNDFLHLNKWVAFSKEKLSSDTPVASFNQWENICFRLNTDVNLINIPAFCSEIRDEIIAFKKSEGSARRKLPEFIDLLLDNLELAIESSTALIQKTLEVKSICRKLVHEMDFSLLYDKNRKLFSIGMRVSENQLDPSYYDLLASEARLTSFIAIAKGDIPVSHWFHLGRSLVKVCSGSSLASWSGSMFEYLMPCLVMHSPENSLLEETCRNAITCQIDYGNKRKVPWGISESAYNKRDLHLTYQYSNFGVPNLGLKRGLSADLVVSPYSTILAAIFEPAQAADNLRRLKKQGALGVYGFYEAIDFTPSRLPSGQSRVIVKTYMAHHQGMSLVALANVYSNFSMQRRFHSDPTVQATELLLQERTPYSIGTLPMPEDHITIESVKVPVEHVSRRYHTVNRPVPTTQLLSNGNYSVMLTSAGSGFSKMQDLAVTRWREDVTRDNYGCFIYLKDCLSQKVWSAGHQPVCVEADHYEASFAEDRARIVRQDNDILSELEIFVSSEENAEIRRLTLTNQDSTVREIEITSYLEVVLNTQAADVAHPAFSNLFIQTEFNTELSALIANRRPRSAKDKQFWMMHLLLRDRHTLGPIQYETDRARFVGRGKNLMNPTAIFSRDKLSGTVGPVLDPILSLRTRVRLEPGATTHLIFSNGVAESREAIEIMADKFHDPSIFERASALAWTHAHAKLHYLGIEPDEAHLFQRLTTRLLYSDPSLRLPSELLRRNSKDLTGLWAHGISGDYPIILVRIYDIEERNLIRQLLKAQIYFAAKGFVCDLVIMNEKSNSYSQELQDVLEQMAQGAFTLSALTQAHGKVFVLKSTQLSDSDQLLIAAEARVILTTQHGSLSDQVKRTFMLPLNTPKEISLDSRGSFALPEPPLDFFNGLGGFSKNGDEYSIILKNDETTPAPWINVIANPDFGFQVSESGSGYTWSLNSRENQLTPWSNDPVCDPSGEAFYITDIISGAVWSPTAAPIRINKSIYLAHHGQGYSCFETIAYGIYSSLKQFVPVNDSVKISRLVLENATTATRNLSITSYVEWVLGFSRATMAPTTVTEFDPDAQAIFAWNPRNTEHGKRISFSAIIGDYSSYTCDRTEFIGRNSSLNKPAALLINESLGGRSGGGLDPCAALQTEIKLKPKQRVEIIFLLGQAVDRTAARDLIKKIRHSSIDDIFAKVQMKWQHLLEKIQVETPDRSFDLVINRWYLYQTITCRLWARAAFYQAGGAFGFRDQLQDVMAVVLSDPGLAREQILRAASRQFLEGDVQHWWHPPFGRGVRTHFSDDLLWLPYVVSHYIKTTQDLSILNEEVSFLEGPLLKPEQEDSYYTPTQTTLKASIYEHCCRALDYSLNTGVNGLPLMGSGDWNDGMNHVGIGGKGESVWLAWFLHVNLKNFSSLARERNESERALKWSNHADSIIEAVEKNAWDGAWYRRAFFDDGTPLGSNVNDECKIDSLAQSWAVISGAAIFERQQQAMTSVFTELVKPKDEMILLFAPPFDKTPLDPGYIKGYLPGVRENGGQYSHAASWVVIAAALMGDGNKAHELFSFLNPINHTGQLSDVKKYKIEPYVLAGDVYSESPHVGRGGWSWYTGAAGWMYRAGVEFILGLQVSGNEMTLTPCVPDDWNEFKIYYRYGSSLYTIHVERGNNESNKSQKIILIDDGKAHTVRCALLGRQI
jgi:cyclic beta-1,2-glucan synthetase